MRNRQYETHLRLNEKEQRKLDELAKKAGITKSAVLRKLIMGTEVKERPNVDFIELRASAVLRPDAGKANAQAFPRNARSEGHVQFCKVR